MVPEKISGNPRILVAPLDWGLGHATRCIPIIRELISQKAEVILAGEGAQEQLLRSEFPGLQFLPLQGYRIKYARTGPGLLWNILYQTPKIIRSIREENAWLKQVVIDHRINGVISDNRYGLYHSTIPCIFLTHQLTIKTPWGKWTDQLLQKRNYSYIEKFSACWVPDAPGPVNLAGDLSHPSRKPHVPLSYLGVLSRFTAQDKRSNKEQVLFLISGPEPQRSQFENLVFKQLEVHPVISVVVRGLPGNANLVPSTNTIRFYNHLPALTLQQEIEDAEFVIARSGYSTIMDLARMKKNAILIPTPGQTEQEYLSKYLAERKMAYSVLQSNFDLKKSISEAKRLNYHLEEPFVGKEIQFAVTKFLSLI